MARRAPDRTPFFTLATLLALASCRCGADTAASRGNDDPRGAGGTPDLDPGAGGASPGSGGAAASGGRGTPTRVGAGGAPTTAGGAGSGGGSTIGSGGRANPAPDAGSSAGGDSGAPDPGPPEGDAHIVKRMGDPSFDSVVTNPSASTVAWLHDHFYRMEVFTTFFDDKTSFYPEGWVYSDSQVIYPGSSAATDHPDWVLKDTGGRAVYLDWGCSNGSCPQYAADVGNAAFRSAWIGALESALAKGYRGAWIDDVNLALRFSDGTRPVAAYSPATNAEMTEDAWAAAVAAFMAEIHAALAGHELLHNSIWYARPTRTADPYVRQQIQAADVINMEGGFASDGGLTGGTGEWSVDAKMGFADVVHGLGKWVVVDDFPSNDAEREYALACYFLLSNGKDGLGDASMAPSTWWTGYDVHLGRALSARSRSDGGVFRRQFQNGLVLMLEPGAATTTIPLPGPHVTIDGAEVTQVTLSAKRGAVLVAR